MSMYHIAESIEICRQPDEVLASLRDIEARMRLNPSFTIVGFERLNDRETGGEIHVRFFLFANGKRFRHDIVEVVEKDRIISRAIDGGLRVTLSVTPTAQGTRLLHEEEFFIPDEVLLPEPAAGKSFKLFRQLLRMFFRFDVHETRKERKADEIIAGLRQSLRIWLGRIRKNIERENMILDRSA